MTEAAKQPGRTAYQGFEYQLTVSVWLALNFLFEERGVAEAVEVEPLGGEDLEILKDRASVQSTEERRTGFQLGAPTQWKYIIQIKGRSIGQWAPGDLAEIINGPKGDPSKDRTWPKDIMAKDPSTTLLFVTDSSLSPQLLWFQVDGPHFELRSTALPEESVEWHKELRNVDPKILQRVGVLTTKIYELVKRNIAEQLALYLNVPHSRRPRFQKALVDRFRAAMLDTSKATITADEIRGIAQEFGGLPVIAGPFVEPLLWAEMKNFLEQKHGIVIVGEPGMGKTTAAEHLIHDYKTRPAPFEEVRPRTPSELRELASRKEPTLVYVEDPFGRHQRDGAGDDWRVELENFCSKLSSDLKLAVTSREAFAAPYLEHSKDAPRLGGYAYCLHENAFDRKKLLCEHLRLEQCLDESKRRWISKIEAKIVQKLDRPICYGRFLALVVQIPNGEKLNNAKLEDLLKTASSAELGKDLENTFSAEQPGCQRGLAAIWLVLEAFHGESYVQECLDVLKDELIDNEVEIAGAIHKLKEHRWLSEENKQWKMHPSYVEACLNVLRRKEALTKKVIVAILRYYMGQNNIDRVAALFRAAHEHAFMPPTLSKDICSFVDRLLEEGASNQTSGLMFKPVNSILERIRPENNLLWMVAGALCFKAGGLEAVEPWGVSPQDVWSAPAWTKDEAKLKRAKESPGVSVLVRAFVREGFPGLHLSGWGGVEHFVEFLYELTDVSAEFDAVLDEFDAVLDEIWRFDSTTTELIALGSVRSKNADPIRILKLIAKLMQEYEKWERRQRPINEDDDDYIDHLDDRREDRVCAPFALADALLCEKFILDDRIWDEMKQQPLVFDRFKRSLRYSRENWNEAVIRRLVRACPPPERGDFLKEGIEKYKAFDWGHELQAIAEEVPPFERVGLAHELWESIEPQLFSALTTHFDEAERSALALLQGETTTMVPDCPAILKDLVRSNLPSSCKAFKALVDTGDLPEGVHTTWFSANARHDETEAAWEALANAPERIRFTYACEGLRHAGASVRKRALWLLSGIPGEDAIRAIMSLENDPTPSVRICVARALSTHPEASAWEGLVRLLNDSTDTSDARYRPHTPHTHYEPKFGVAEEAALGLKELKESQPWPEDLKKAVDSFLGSRSITRTSVQKILSS